MRFWLCCWWIREVFFLKVCVLDMIDVKKEKRHLVFHALDLFSYVTCLHRSFLLSFFFW